MTYSLKSALLPSVLIFSSGAYFFWFACPVFSYDDKDYGETLTFIVGSMLGLPTDKPLDNADVAAKTQAVETAIAEHCLNPLNLYAALEAQVLYYSTNAFTLIQPYKTRAYVLLEPTIANFKATWDYILFTETDLLCGYSLARLLWLCENFNLYFGWFIIFFFIFAFFFFMFEKTLQAYNEKIVAFFKTNTFLSTTFLTNIDVTLSFIYFFLSLYFLELHFFFVYTYNLSSDSTIYQFNFLMSSFFFIFFIKSTKSIFDNGFLFSVSFGFNELFFFTNSGTKALKNSIKSPNANVNFFVFSLLYKFSLKFFFFIFFFFSTFFVWFLRYLIQFVRLLVLFMIHTIFELVIISSDAILSQYFLNSFFIIKYIFFIFFFTFSFLYLIIYLNLMFTLQVFIFYFFSEVFQSNFVTDLSSFIAAKAKRL